MILDAFSRAWNDHQVVIVTGGLGPTHDDVTRRAVVEFFGTDLVEDAGVLEDIERLLRNRGRSLSPVHAGQALVPRGAAIIRNPLGTAPGFLFEREGKIFCALPGVPHEMMAMVDPTLISYLSGRSGRVVRSLTLRTTGIVESALAEALGDPEQIAGGGTLAFLPSSRGVRLRVTVAAKDEADAQERLRAARDRIRSRAGEYIYAEGEVELEEVVGRELAARGETIAVAESCTGGLVAHRLTNIAGSSRYFMQGVVTYSDESKIRQLGVPGGIIERNGAVSEETARVMAERIRILAGTTYGLSTTGIAGPGGATPDKPVGLVWIGFSRSGDTRAFGYRFGEQRRVNKERAAQTAIDILRRILLGLPVK